MKALYQAWGNVISPKRSPCGPVFWGINMKTVDTELLHKADARETLRMFWWMVHAMVTNRFSCFQRELRYL